MAISPNVATIYKVFKHLMKVATSVFYRVRKAEKRHGFNTHVWKFSELWTVDMDGTFIVDRFE